MNIYTSIKSSSGAAFGKDVTVGGEKLVKESDFNKVKEKVDKNHPDIISVGSFFIEDSNQYEGYRIKILSDSDGNVTEVITGSFGSDGSWQDETGIQAAIYGMNWNSTDSKFEDPVPIAYADGTFPTENTFDKLKIAPWCDIKYEEVEETVNGNTIKQCLAGVPKFYYTGVQIPANTVTLPGSTSAIAYKGFVQIVSSVPLKSFTLWDTVVIPDAKVYEEFVLGDKEVDYVYDNVYRAAAMKVSDQSVATSAAWSDNSDASGDYILVSQPRSEKTYPVAPRSAELFARKLNTLSGKSNTTYTGGTWQQYYRMKLLYRIEFNTINSQQVIAGQVNYSATNYNAGYTDCFICKAIEACIPYSGTMDYSWKCGTCASSCGASITSSYYNPLIYRYHSDLFSIPYCLPTNFFIARDPSETSSCSCGCCSSSTGGGVYYWLGNCRSCVFNWTGTNDSTSCLSDYVQYYDKVLLSSSSSCRKDGWVKNETWNKDGIFNPADIETLDYNLNGGKSYGDYAYVYYDSSDLPVAGTSRFAPVWLSSGADYGYDGASALYADGGDGYYWGGGFVFAGSGLSAIFS